MKTDAMRLSETGGMSNPGTRASASMARPPGAVSASGPGRTQSESGYTPQQEIRNVLQGVPAKLNQGLGAIDSEIGRLQRNLARVKSHMEEIHNEEVVAHYRQAEAEIVQQVDQALSMREGLYQQVVELDQAAQSVLDALGVANDTDKLRRQRVQKHPATRQPPLATIPPPDPAGRKSPPRKPTASKASGKSKKDDVLSDQAMTQHAAAILGLSPEKVNKAMKKSKKSRG